MAFQVSPGVNVSEVDLTTVVPSILTTAGAFVGHFVWGPANKRILIDSENTLKLTFSQPDSNTYVDYYTASNFLSYGNNLTVVRALGDNNYNADSNNTTTNTTIANEDVYLNSLISGNTNYNGPFTARYPGAIGNSLKISVIDSGCSFTGWQVDSVNVSSYFAGAPGTSAQCKAAGGANDEIHIIVTDALGYFTGTKGSVLEVFPFLSKASDAVDTLGLSNYYKNALLNRSKYIYAVDPVDYTNTSASWGKTLSNNFTTLSLSQTFGLAGGTDVDDTNAGTQLGLDLLSNTQEVDVSLIITGDYNTTLQKYAIGIAESRKDCVVFISPPASAVIGKSNADALTAIQTWNTTLGTSSSYTVADSGWKYMYDKYNNVYRWIPLNADVAGLCVYTDAVRDPWFSPAGFNRGQIKNAVKLAWTPSKTQSDALYNIGINTVGTFPGQGTVLFGDKTLQTKPSSFDRINVRRLFIILEKSIAKAAQYSLFEFNDEFTRAQFIALVTPFLRDVQGRRGIFDFKVVCDNTNNTSQIIDSNQFVGDIYIKPARSINFIQLNFVAVGTGVDFNEIVGNV